MDTMELSRIGNRSDAIELLDELIKLARAGKKSKTPLFWGCWP